MKLALDFFLLILVELPILVLFFKRKKRQNAVYMGLLINIISWSVAHVIFFSTEVNIYYIQGLIIIGEAIAFNKLLEVTWKKSHHYVAAVEYPELPGKPVNSPGRPD